MDRCIYHYGIHVALFFLGVALVMKFVVENCMIACFIFIYNSLYWDLIKEDSSQIYLNFDKTTREKKKQIQRSIFSRGSTINQLRASQSSPNSPELVFGKTKNISNFLYINRAIKHFKKNRGGPTQLRSQTQPKTVIKQETKILADPELENISEYYHGESPSQTIRPQRQDSPFKNSVTSNDLQESVIDKPESKPNIPFEIEVLETSQTAQKQATLSSKDRASNSFQGEIPQTMKPNVGRGVSKSFHLDKDYLFPPKSGLHSKKLTTDLENEETTAKDGTGQLLIHLETEDNNLVEKKQNGPTNHQIDLAVTPVDESPMTPTNRSKKNKIFPRKARNFRKQTSSKLDL